MFWKIRTTSRKRKYSVKLLGIRDCFLIEFQKKKKKPRSIIIETVIALIQLFFSMFFFFIPDVLNYEKNLKKKNHRHILECATRIILPTVIMKSEFN